MDECEEYWPECPICERTWGRKEYNSWFFPGWRFSLVTYEWMASDNWFMCKAYKPNYSYVRPVCWAAKVTMEDGAVEHASWLMGPPQRWIIEWPQNPDRHWRELRAGVDIARRNDDLDAMTYAFTTMPKEKSMKTREEKIKAVEDFLQQERSKPSFRSNCERLATRIIDVLDPLPKPPNRIDVFVVYDSEARLRSIHTTAHAAATYVNSLPYRAGTYFKRYRATLVDED